MAETVCFKELSAILLKYHSAVIAKSRSNSREIITFCLDKIIRPLLQKVGEIESRMRCSLPVATASYFEGLKVPSAHEFKIITFLKNLLSVKGFEDLSKKDPRLACYGYVIVKHSTQNINDLVSPVPENTTIQKYFKILSAFQVRTRFFEIIRQASSCVNVEGATFIVFYEDPYTVVRVTRNDSNYDFKVTPALHFKEWPQNAKTWGEIANDWLKEVDVKTVREKGIYVLPMPCAINNDKYLWRISFNAAEKYLLRQEGDTPQKTIRKMCKRILKTIQEKNPTKFGVAGAYHIKTVLLHDCMKWPKDESWSQAMVGEKFMELFQHLISALSKRELMHFFLPACNLFSCYSEEDLQTAVRELQYIYDEISVHPHECEFLQCEDELQEVA